MRRTLFFLCAFAFLNLAFVSCSPGTKQTITFTPSATKPAKPTIDYDSTIYPDINITQVPYQELKSDWLRGIPCHLPCWEDVTPGKTTWLDAMDIWKQNPLFRRVNTTIEKSGYSSNGVIKFHLNVASSENGFATYSLGEKSPIDRIQIGNSLYHVTLSELIAAFGTPSSVTASIEESFFEEPGYSWMVFIAWNNKGLLFGEYKTTFNINKNEIVQMVIDGDVGYSQISIESDINKINTYTDIDGNPLIAVPWHGYDEIAGYLPNEIN